MQDTIQWISSRAVQPNRNKPTGTKKVTTSAGTRRRSAVAALGGQVIVVDVADAGALFGRPGFVTRLDLTLQADADRDQVRRTRDRYRDERNAAYAERDHLRAQLAATTASHRAETRLADDARP